VLFIFRLHRLGQKRDVLVYRLICEDSVEERLLQLQEKKRKLSQQAIGDEFSTPQGGNKLTIEELRSFFM